ncbi:MAG TPA: arginine N-succinyltransferase [Gammaproteobacteria bacterium]|nr:arginine N-succinyltransferase [Gammaproteobacteria bacterium]
MQSKDEPVPPRRFDRLHVTLMVLLAVVVTAVLTVWLVKVYVFPDEFEPVTLSAGESRTLEDKLSRLEATPQRRRAANETPALQPEAYSEAGASREIAFTERELNALLANNTDLARKLAIDLSDDLLSVKLLLPMDEDFPVLGGKTLKVHAGVELAFHDGRPVVVLKGVSVMGVPLPNAWQGNLKNIDLVREFGQQGGFWAAFADGVESMRVENGRLDIRLKE